MTMQAIAGLAKEYIVLGGIAAVILLAAFCAGYFLVYRKLLHGQWRPEKRYVALAAVTLCYVTVLMGAVFVSRGGVYGGGIQLIPFASYREAWNNWSAVEWRNIVLNIFLFVPVGVLLPLWSRKFQKTWKTVLAGFFLTLAIEIIQYATGRGIFEMDDLTGNTFGVWLGYGILSLVICGVKKETCCGKKILWKTAPVFILVAGSLGIFGAYHLKELGNLSSTYSVRQNMKKTELTLDCTLSDKSAGVPVYQMERLNESKARELAEKVFAAKGTAVDESQTDWYDDAVFFYAPGKDGDYSARQYSIHVDYGNLSCYYSDFSSLEKTGFVEDAPEEEIRRRLEETGFEIPDGCSFSVEEDGNYQFRADMLKVGNQIVDGAVYCGEYDGENLGFINYCLYFGRDYRDGEIISETEAFERIQQGKFKSFLGQESIHITEVRPGYELDSKGYYQPVYEFVLDDGMWITIPALAAE